MYWIQRAIILSSVFLILDLVDIVLRFRHLHTYTSIVMFINICAYKIANGKIDEENLLFSKNV